MRTVCIGTLLPLWVCPANVACNACQGVLVLVLTQDTVHLRNMHDLLLVLVYEHEQAMLCPIDITCIHCTETSTL